MRNAWHEVIGEYDHDIVYKAVMTYVRNDTRDYASFPAPGVIIKEIKAELKARQKPIREVLDSINKGRKYEELTSAARDAVSEEKYNAWLKMNPIRFIEQQNQFIDEMMGRKTLHD